LKTDIIKPEIMLRIRDKNLLERLQDQYDLSSCTSVNEFLNTILHSFVFRENLDEIMLDKLDEIQDKTNATYELVKRNVR
jgi:hypothetical protein